MEGRLIADHESEEVGDVGDVGTSGVGVFTVVCVNICLKLLGFRDI